MKVSVRAVVTVLAAVMVLGGLVRLSLDKRRVEVSMPEVPSASGSDEP
jgi:predicted lysophospholipase L1 biosynthesis ABC-type transport system permease subunit